MVMKSLKIRKLKSFWLLRIHGYSAISVWAFTTRATCKLRLGVGTSHSSPLGVVSGSRQKHSIPSLPDSLSFLSRVKSKIQGKAMTLVTPDTNKFQRGRTHEPRAKPSWRPCRARAPEFKLERNNSIDFTWWWIQATCQDCLPPSHTWLCLTVTEYSQWPAAVCSSQPNLPTAGDHKMRIFLTIAQNPVACVWELGTLTGFPPRGGGGGGPPWDVSFGFSLSEVYIFCILSHFILKFHSKDWGALFSISILKGLIWLDISKKLMHQSQKYLTPIWVHLELFISVLPLSFCYRTILKKYYFV